MTNYQDMHINDLRKLGQELKVKNYNALPKSELVREIRLKEEPITPQDVVAHMKKGHALICDLVKQRQAKGEGYSSYIGISEQIRSQINRLEKLL